MTGINHLGNTDELLSFMKSMNNELQKHKKEKFSMRDYTFWQTMMNNIPEIKKRITKINDLFNKIQIERDGGEVEKMTNEINKQFIHIANYSLMGWLKSK